MNNLIYIIKSIKKCRILEYFLFLNLIDYSFRKKTSDLEFKSFEKLFKIDTAKLKLDLSEQKQNLLTIKKEIDKNISFFIVK